MKLSFTLLFFLFKIVLIQSQDLRIFHGEYSESVFMRPNETVANASREKINIIRGTDGIISITIINPNPFFYSYEIKTEDVEIVDDYSNQFEEVVKLLGSIPDISDITNPPGRIVTTTSYDNYLLALQNVDAELEEAKVAIEKSDTPELIQEALDRKINSSGFGFRSAIDDIRKLSSAKNHFNSRTLEEDLNALLQKTIDDGTFNSNLGLGTIGTNPTLEALYKKSYQSLNSTLASNVNKIIQTTQRERVLRFYVPVKENKKTNVRIIIKRLDENRSTVRELFDEEIATITPLYVRKTFEIVPAINLVFQQNRQQYSLEDGLIVSNPDDDAKFNAGAMALVNLANFGDFKEYGVGVGLGYSIQPEGKASTFFAMPSVSYKDIFRLGFGFGYSLAPVGLKQGANIGEPLPPNISNIEDVVDYKRKAAAVLTLTIGGLKI